MCKISTIFIAQIAEIRYHAPRHWTAAPATVRNRLTASRFATCSLLRAKRPCFMRRKATFHRAFCRKRGFGRKPPPPRPAVRKRKKMSYFPPFCFEFRPN